MKKSRAVFFAFLFIHSSALADERRRILSDVFAEKSVISPTHPEEMSRKQQMAQIQNLLKNQEEWKEWNYKFAVMTEGEKKLSRTIDGTDSGTIALNFVNEIASSTGTYWQNSVKYMNPDKKAEFYDAFMFLMDNQAPIDLIYAFLAGSHSKLGAESFENYLGILSKPKRKELTSLARDKYEGYHLLTKKEYDFNLLIFRPATAPDWNTYSMKDKLNFRMRQMSISRKEKLELVQREAYTSYMMEMERLNLEREQRNLPRRDIKSFEEWMDQRVKEQRDTATQQFIFAESISRNR